MTERIVVTTRLPGDAVGMIREDPIGRAAEIVHLDEPRWTGRHGECCRDDGRW